MSWWIATDFRESAAARLPSWWATDSHLDMHALSHALSTVFTDATLAVSIAPPQVAPSNAEIEERAVH